ncbi:MAG: dihydropteroate synthase [Akkermansia sp.]
MNTRHWTLRRGVWQLPAGGAIMGILNITPDSFSDGGEHGDTASALAHADKLLADGAHIIDLGGESTRPGSAEVSIDEEARRVLPVLRELRRRHPQALLSVDTRHPAVAEQALEAGADIINDITGLADPAMRALCAAAPCGIVLMHMQGQPRTMQLAPHYDDVVREVRAFFEQRLALAEAAGIARERICLDPGIGFGKNVEHNLALIAHLEELRVADLPLLMALSRKRFMGAVLSGGAPAPVREALPTVVMSLLAADRGADLHRVHDVRELRDALRLREAVLGA